MFIVLEGLDGAGKSTQIRMLRQLLAERGVESEYVHFPRFDAPVYGELIARFLRGEFGGVNEVVNPAGSQKPRNRSTKRSAPKVPLRWKDKEHTYRQHTRQPLIRNKEQPTADHKRAWSER